ncbi:adenylosuccinate lyase family protein [Streptomyces griseoincarnatus]
MTTTAELPAPPGADVPTRCRHARGHITDSSFLGDRYATAASRRIFCDVCRVQRWLDVEAALALTQGEMGMIPAAAAADIAAAARVDRIDLDTVREETQRSGHSLIGLLRALQQACPGESGEYIHFGATTQDIQDTGQVLEMRDAMDELDTALRHILTLLCDIAEEHAETVALGRTHARPALPMSFGLKVAAWADEMCRNAERLAEARPRLLVAQLFGGAGTMAGFGGRGQELLERFAERCGLYVPNLGWHVARDRIVEYTCLFGTVAGTAARIADEIRTLSRPEFGEVEEAWRYGKVGSSTMPHKRNPERCEQVVVMAKLAAGQVPLALAGMAGDHERDSRALRVEWACLPDVTHYTLAACQILTEILQGLTVHVPRLRANVQIAADQVASERLMFALAEFLGKQTAHERVYALSQTAYQERRPMKELLAEEPDLARLLDEKTVEEIFEPAQYLGDSVALTRRGVASVRDWLDAPRAGQVSG